MTEEKKKTHSKIHSCTTFVKHIKINGCNLVTLKIHGLDLCCSIVHFLITSFTMDDTKEEKFFVQENVFSSLFEKRGKACVV